MRVGKAQQIEGLIFLPPSSVWARVHFQLLPVLVSPAATASGLTDKVPRIFSSAGHTTCV